MLAAEFLDEHFEPIFENYGKLLHSDNYVTRRQSLKLLGELLLDRHNFSVSSLFHCPANQESVRVRKFIPLSFVPGDDPLHFQPRQLEADDEHAQGKVEKHPIRSLPRIQGKGIQPT